MKVHSIKSNTARRLAVSAFTLIEMIGVLAVIAILAAMLIPKVFEAINSARINNAAVSCETIKTAAADHYGKYGKLISQWGTNDMSVPIAAYDKSILLPEQLIDKPFTCKIAGGDPSTNSIVHLVLASASGPNNTGYNLDGTGTNIVNSAQQNLLECIMFNVAVQDAKDLNDRVDGLSLGTNTLTAGDTFGRVEYTTPNASGQVNVYVYLTHR